MYQTLKSFSPTQEQLSAARDLLVATAIIETVEPVVRAYQREILAEARWSVGQDLDEHFPEGKIILDPKDAFMLGDADAEVYYRRCYEARDRANLKVSRPDNCPLCEAEWALTQARWRLVDSMESVTGLSRDQVLRQGMDNYKRYIELSLCLMTPFLEKSGEAMLKEACCDA